MAPFNANSRNPLSWLKAPFQSIDPAVQAARQKIARNSFCRLESAIEIAIAAEMGIAIDANRASADDWLRLPGISIRQATLLAQLSAGGVIFHSLDDVAAALSLPPSQLVPLAPVLRFYFYDPEAPSFLQPIDANWATIEQLERLPGVDRTLAEQMVRDRQQRGNFRSLVDLQRRLHLSGELVSELMHYLRFA
ncbi:MAG: ComEA family DNA-binding protein [Oscillatoriales cyanobacterium]|nr:MAG: ComEA family DNA-binding protein [Oscillatoriales cyanobacterium]